MESPPNNTEGVPQQGNPSPDGAPLAEWRVPIPDLSRVHGALAQSLGEAGIGGPELERIFASGVKSTCVACGLSITGVDLGDLALQGSDDTDRPPSPRLERLRLGYCPRQGCESRFFRIELTAPGRFDRGQVLGRAQRLLEGDTGPLLRMAPAFSSETTQRLRRVAGIGLATLFVAFVAYRLVFFRSQPIPFIQPKSPYTVEPASIDPNQR